MERMSTMVFTLCFIQKDDQVLLGRKQRGFGAGYWNGFGGKVEATDASLEAAAQREVKEECDVGVTLQPADKVGILTFRFTNNSELREVHVYRTSDFSGTINETGEMQKLCWFKTAELPYAEMWEADQRWLPLLLAGKTFNGDILFDEANHLLEYSVIEEGAI